MGAKVRDLVYLIRKKQIPHIRHFMKKPRKTLGERKPKNGCKSAGFCISYKKKANPAYSPLYEKIS